MQQLSNRSAGISMLVGSVLLLVTMVLHPSGGSVEHLLAISTMIIVAHGIAIGSIPVLYLGFKGLSRHLASQGNPLLAVLGHYVMSIALLAGMLAATVNGLALPFFVQHLAEASAEQLTLAHMILDYNHSLNQAFDYLFIIGVCAAILLWSVQVLRYRLLPVWLGYAGVALNLGAFGLLYMGINLIGLFGFRLFIFSLAGWIVAAAVSLLSRPGKTLTP